MSRPHKEDRLVSLIKDFENNRCTHVEEWNQELYLTLYKKVKSGWDT
jgi:hypothetical protein